MSARTRLIVMTISAPVVAFAIVGGFLGKVMAREDTYQHLKIFDDVVGLVSSNYVEEADMDKVMRGAMRGLAEGLDPDSAYLTPDQVRQVESGAPPAPLQRIAGGRRRHGGAVRAERHARDLRIQGGRARADRRELERRDGLRADRGADRHGHVGRGGAVRIGAGRQPPRRSDR